MKKLAVLSLLLIVSFSNAGPQRPGSPGGDAIEPNLLTADGGN